MKIKEIAEKQKTLYSRMNEMLGVIEAESREFTEEEQRNWDEINKDYNVLQSLKEKRQELLKHEENFSRQMDQIASEIQTSRSGVEDEYRKYQDQVDLGIRAWGKAIIDKRNLITEREQAAIDNLGFNLNSSVFHVKLGSFRQALHQYRSLSVYQGANGAFVAGPESFAPSLEMALLSFGSVMQAADVIRTSDGNPLKWPTVDDTSNKGRLLAEKKAATELDPSFGQQVWRAYEYTSDAILVPNSLLEDSAINLPSVIAEMLGERIGRIYEEHFTTGDDNAKPEGLVTAAAASTATDVAATLGGDDLISLFHAVDPAQRTAGFGWMAHDAIWGEVRKLKAGDDNYLWIPGFAERPDTVLGWPVFTNQEMDSTIATGNKIMLAGNFRKYKIRMVGEFRLKRLVERYGEQDCEAFILFSRTDGRLLNPGSSDATNPVHLLTVS